MASRSEGLAGQGLRLLGEGLNAAGTTLANTTADLVRSRPDNPLDDRDPEFIRTTLPTYRGLTQLYFRPKVRGLEHIPPKGPVLLVGNHSGGTLIADTFAFAYAFYTYFGAQRRFHQLAHDLAVGLPGISIMLRKYGTVNASHENAERALKAGAALLVYPGGDYESYRPSWHSGSVEFGGRSGFVRLALKQGVPIVPVVAIGGQETALFVTRGQRLASALQLDRLRLKVLPIQVAPPFGVSVLDLPPRIPLPAQITIQVLPKIDLAKEFGAKPDEKDVSQGITDRMQDALDDLNDERDLPVVGTVGPRTSESAFPGSEVQPWQGYDKLSVGEIATRLKRKPDEVVSAAKRYEETHKRRKGVLGAVERELARR